VTSNIDTDSLLFNWAWLIVVLLFLDWLLNIPFIVWKLIVWMKTPGIIDVKLMVQQKKGEIKA
jgi:hypothetical protein